MEQSRIAPVRKASLCRYCRRELVIQQVKARTEGRFVEIVLRCPKHGTVGRGERYLQGYVSAS